MQNNQQSGSQQGGQDKPKQTLSWAEPPQMLQKTTGGQTTNPVRTNPTNEKKETASRPWTMFIIGLIVGCLVTWVWIGMRASKSETPASGGSPSLSTGSTTAAGTSSSSAGGAQTGVASSGIGSTAASNDTITVPTPQNAGTSVEVSSISASDTVWAVVYEDINGSVGNALGAARFTTARTSGSIELIRTTLPNLTYFVGLTEDTPDHTFSIKTNKPILDANGNQIMTQFAAQ